MARKKQSRYTLYRDGKKTNVRSNDKRWIQEKARLHQLLLGGSYEVRVDAIVMGGTPDEERLHDMQALQCANLQTDAGRGVSKPHLF